MTLGVCVSKSDSEVLRKLLLSHNLLNKELLPCIERDNIIHPLCIECNIKIPFQKELVPEQIPCSCESKNTEINENILLEHSLKMSQLSKLLEEIKLEAEFRNDVQFSLKGKRKISTDVPKVTIKWVKNEAQKYLGNRPLSVELWDNGLCIIHSGLQNIDEETVSSFVKSLVDNACGQIQVIACPQGGHEGPFRIQAYKLLYPYNTQDMQLLETSVKENGVVMKLNLATVWYSKRFEQERERIASLIQKSSTKEKEKENILCLFAGIGPFPIILLKRVGTYINYIYASELNPNSYKYAIDNAKRNGFSGSRISIAHMEATEYCRYLQEKGIIFDRIIMPAPRTEDTSLLTSFIKNALLVARKGTLIHFYDHVPSNILESRAKEICEDWSNGALELLEAVVCGQQSPHNYRVCYDLLVSKNINLASKS